MRFDPGLDNDDLSPFSPFLMKWFIDSLLMSPKIYVGSDAFVLQRQLLTNFKLYAFESTPKRKLNIIE